MSSDIRRDMLSAYFETEQQFIEISRLIPLDNSPDTYSTRLYDILQSLCGQVENLLRLLCEKLNLESEGKNFPSYFNTLNQTGVLKFQLIDLLNGSKVYIPFGIDSGKDTPNWWRGYNDTKHDLPNGYKQGNLNNTTFALTAAYALNCLFAYVELLGNDILDIKKWVRVQSIGLNTRGLNVATSDSIGDIRPKSKILFPVSYYKGEGAEI